LWAVSFYPLIVVEHAAFVAGLAYGVVHRVRRKQGSDTSSLH
jgi:hypothetical protein